MKTFIALLRGINVGGHNILPMADLRTLCEEEGLKKVRTYIQSGNVLFESKESESALIEQLEEALKKKTDKNISVIIRSPEELQSVLARNPYPDAEPSKIGILFLKEGVPESIFAGVPKQGPEEVTVSGREIFIHYPEGMGRSKLEFPRTLPVCTMRNLNSVTKILALAGSRD